jgi:hypothetical protein
MNNDQKWQVAQIQERWAISHLEKINFGSGQISHAQAEAVLIAFLQKSGFKDLAIKFKNLQEELGWTYTEET